MKDYSGVRMWIKKSCPHREQELDDYLKDEELVTAIERMCRKSNIDAVLYAKFLMENCEKIPGNPDLLNLARAIRIEALRTRPDMC